MIRFYFILLQYNLFKKFKRPFLWGFMKTTLKLHYIAQDLEQTFNYSNLVNHNFYNYGKQGTPVALG